MTDIDKRVVVVTGAAGNLGAATAKLLASRGAKLVLVDRDEKRIREALGDIARSPAATSPTSRRFARSSSPPSKSSGPSTGSSARWAGSSAG